MADCGNSYLTGYLACMYDLAKAEVYSYMSNMILAGVEEDQVASVNSRIVSIAGRFGGCNCPEFAI